ncbi:hypothetical protein QMK33_06275 [Hymenobacter sp. H14-R3]|uniref:hypothetical protein n=1 Tax=Hymenobacter sp. H14-R3 TaxID=3046308 RepID=UPI0024B9D27C|nr:hypothetical protein [Hymenobacter sp. H14-R3]MDJ0364751.1 hypothetical protein [Hymenobacter sp. H14-R3]
MEHLLKILAQHWDFGSEHYWHLRLLCSLLVAPMLGVLYVLFFDKRERPKLRAAAGLKPTMRVNSEGQLLH